MPGRRVRPLGAVHDGRAVGKARTVARGVEGEQLDAAVVGVGHVELGAVVRIEGQHIVGLGCADVELVLTLGRVPDAEMLLGVGGLHRVGHLPRLLAVEGRLRRALLQQIPGFVGIRLDRALQLIAACLCLFNICIGRAARDPLVRVDLIDERGQAICVLRDCNQGFVNIPFVLHTGLLRVLLHEVVWRGRDCASGSDGGFDCGGANAFGGKVKTDSLLITMERFKIANRIELSSGLCGPQLSRGIALANEKARYLQPLPVFE